MSLFTGCLAVSFLVVGMPHILPCPVDRRQFSDSGPDPSKKRRRKVRSEGDSDVSNGKQNDEDDGDARRRRECPVPKPKGLIGQIMGFPDAKDRDGAVVVVKPLQDGRQHRRRIDDEGS